MSNSNNNNNESSSSDDNDKELTDLFNRAISYTSTHKIPGLNNDNQLYLYSHFKQSTVGKCNTKQPSFYEFIDRAKWSAWNKLGDMSKSEAMNKYIEFLNKLIGTNWKDNQNNNINTQNISTTTTTTTTTTTNNNNNNDDRNNNNGDEDIFTSSDDEDKKGNAGMGPVMSRFSMVDQQLLIDVNNMKKDLCYWVSTNDVNTVRGLISKENVNEKDEQGRTPLIWSADRGNLEMAKLIIENGGNLDDQDEEGMTALHYACMCSYIDIVSLLLEKGAKKDIKDVNDQTPYEITDSSDKDIKDLLK